MSASVEKLCDKPNPDFEFVRCIAEVGHEGPHYAFMVLKWRDGDVEIPKEELN
jgi:hypothetical protein